MYYGNTGYLNFTKLASGSEAMMNAEAAGYDQMEGAEGMDPEMMEKLEEDLLIAQEISETNLPIEIKVEILENEGVESEIIEQVIQEEANDAVAAYYGLDPRWVSDVVDYYRG